MKKNKFIYQLIFHSSLEDKESELPSINGSATFDEEPSPNGIEKLMAEYDSTYCECYFDRDTIGDYSVFLFDVDLAKRKEKDEEKKVYIIYGRNLNMPFHLADFDNERDPLDISDEEWKEIAMTSGGGYYLLKEFENAINSGKLIIPIPEGQSYDVYVRIL